jgi:hypothetical protein
MSSDSIKREFNQLSSDFMANNMDAVLHRYAPKLPVYLGSELLMIEGHAALKKALMITRKQILEDGVINLKAIVVAQSIPRDGRFRIIVDWLYFYGSGETRKSQCIYYCRKNAEGGLLFEMLEYRHLAFEDAHSWYVETNETSLKVAYS